MQQEGEDAASLREQLEEQKRLFDEIQEKATVAEGEHGLKKSPKNFCRCMGTSGKTNFGLRTTDLVCAKSVDRRFLSSKKDIKNFLETFNTKLETKLQEQKESLEKYYKEQMDEDRVRLQKENEELSEQLKSFDQTNEEKNSEINRLEKKSELLAEEISKLEEELDKKNTELKNFGKKTDEYLR